MDFSVFARWRPLTDAELPQGEIVHETRLETNEHFSVSLQHAQQPAWKSEGAFTFVHGIEDDNLKVFDSMLSQAIPKVLTGSTCNIFAYGHTGSGKTHTIIGYDYKNVDQLGLCLAAGRWLFEVMGASEDTNKLGIGFSLFEIRKNIAFDLLNGKTACHIRQGADGKVHMRGQTEILEDGKVRVKPIKQAPCWNYVDLLEQLQKGLQERATGTSTMHNQSSRTHAVLELEILSPQLVEAREELYERQSELVPVGKRATDVYLAETMKSLVVNEDGHYVAHPDRPVDQVKIDEAEATKNAFELRVAAAEKRIKDLLGAKPYLGGKLVFVDLAGSEYQSETGTASRKLHQTAQERQEGRQINTDLLALKEVIRAFATGQSRIPFRSSPLTMVLREHFVGTKQSTSAMVVTISPANEQYTATMDSLKYGSLVGAACASKSKIA